jgi:hypothetical protein
MNDTKPYSYSTPVDWWWVAAHINALIDTYSRTNKEVRWEHKPTPNGIVIEGYLDDYRGAAISILMAAGNNRTVVMVLASPAMTSFWEDAQTSLETFTTSARQYRRLAVGVQFREIIEQYYQAIDRKEKPSLKEMAAAAGVNYGSLRHAKRRYDAEHKQHV